MIRGGLMKFLEKISKKIGFTGTETNIILFILLACLIGIALNIIKSSKNEKEFLEFDYSREDSLFSAASGDPGIEDSNLNSKEKIIASQHELLDFTKEKLEGRSFDKKPPLTKIINLNSATEPELAQLPGFGKKTAAAVIAYRSKHGKIKELKELLNVKGIGQKKLEKIRNLIVIE